MHAMMPWTGANLRREMDRLFERFFEPGWPPELPTIGEWAPSLDVSETKDSVVVKMEVPGIEAKDISVSLQENGLTVKGEKKQETADKDERYHRVERSYGAFTRTVRLPAAVDGSKVAAGFKNGLLTVTLPKAAGAKDTTIPVKAE
jgi:HSP20 family protein